MRPYAALVALALSGCALNEAHPPFGAPRGPTATWAVQVSATAGAALVQTTPSGGEAVRIACRRRPQDLQVTADGLKATSGPVALAVGDRAFPLRAEADGPTLAATGPWPAALPAALMTGGAIGIDVEGRRWRFFPPDQKTVAAFAIACRG